MHNIDKCTNVVGKESQTQLCKLNLSLHEARAYCIV